MAIYDLLPVGEENAVSRRELAQRIGLSDRQLRQRIAAERKKGALILSTTENGGGYFRAGGIQEIKRFVDSMTARGAGVFAAVAAAREALAEFDGCEGG